uniref:Phenoloxidase-activating factor 2 n=1 Tax=Anopheles atroparvus TaxID=41427 RepID=A0A182J033_ANOAO
MRLIISAAFLLLLSTVAVSGADEWGWLPLEDPGLQGVDKVREKRQDVGVLPASQQNATEVSDEDILSFILDSGRQGRSLEGFDEVYSDPSVQEAIQNADDSQARNVIKEKLCELGLMQCDAVVQGKRPYYPIYAQQQPPRPRPPVRGPPLPPQQYPQRPPLPPPQQQGLPPKPQHQGPYGPPQPMPLPNQAQHKIGYGGPQQRPPFGGPPNSFSGPSYASAYPSKPLGPIYESDTPPFEFEHIGAGEKVFESHQFSKPGIVINEGPLVKPVEQHIHHHYHHIDGAADSKTVVVNNPVPVAASVLSGSAVVGGSSSGSSSGGLYSAGGVYGTTTGISSGNGFSPLAGVDFDYKELKGVNSNNGFGQSPVYASQTKPVFEGTSGSSFGQSGGSQSLYNQAPAQFSSNSLYSGEASGPAYQGVNGGGFHSSNPALYKKELNVKGPSASNGLGTYAGNNYSKYSSQYSNGQYAANGGQFGSNGGQFGSNGGQFGSNGGQFGSGGGQFGSNGGQLGSNGGQFGSNGAQLGSNGGQFGSNGGGQYSQFANNGIEDCVCVPYDQCPAQDVIGRKDDLILPLDPRNLKTDIEAATADELVITDGNGTMTVVRVPKNATTDSSSTASKKISKREAAAESKSSDNAKDKANIEPRLLGGGGGNGGDKKVVPTFGVSFGLPFPSGYPLNPYGPHPAQNPYFGSIGANGLNLGLLNVNPLVSLQVTKDEYGDKVLKPLVNLHVTPTENIVHKIGGLLAAKKQNIFHVFNQHEHYHSHQGYPRPPPIYHPGHHHQGPPLPPFVDGPILSRPPPFDHHHHHHGGPPELIYTKPPGPVYGGPGFNRPPFVGGPTPFGPPLGPVGQHPGFGPPPFIGGGPRPPYFRDASSVASDYGGAELGRSTNVTFAGETNAYRPAGNFKYQSVYPQNEPNDINQNRAQYGRQYQNYQNVAQNVASNGGFRLPTPTQNVPTPAPGNAEGSPTVSFPSSRRRRRATDVSVPESLEASESAIGLKEVEGVAAGGSASVQEKSFSTEKRQAYYGPRPGQQQQQQQCSGRQVCCRRPVYRNPPSQNLGKCGVRNAQGINGRIKNPVYVDGDSEFGEYPWQVAILKKDPKESVYVCGGTLIDNLYIITAAHCVKTYNGFDLRVRLGEWDVNHDVEFYPYIERDVISVQVHPEYYAGTLDNDLAILKMDRPVDLTSAPHIAPACLPDKHTDFSGQRCWTTGWGKDAFGDYGKYQNILKEVDVPIVSHYQCQNQLRQTRLGYSYNLNQGFLCAGGEEGKDACKGDGGGPLVCERNGVWQVVGVVSWGIGCGQANVPGVYVKVAHYLDWINQVRGRF